MGKASINADLNDPTMSLTSLSTKLALCLLFLASSILFYHMARRGSTIPPKYAFPVAIFLLLLGCAQSIYATYEYIYTAEKMDDYCKKKKNKCLYDDVMLNHTEIFYLVLCILFILVNFYIAYLLKRYP